MYVNQKNLILKAENMQFETTYNVFKTDFLCLKIAWSFTF